MSKYKLEQNPVGFKPTRQLNEDVSLQLYLKDNSPVAYSDKVEEVVEMASGYFGKEEYQNSKKTFSVYCSKHSSEAMRETFIAVTQMQDVVLITMQNDKGVQLFNALSHDEFLKVADMFDAVRKNIT